MEVLKSNITMGEILVRDKSFDDDFETNKVEMRLSQTFIL